MTAALSKNSSDEAIRQITTGLDQLAAKLNSEKDFQEIQEDFDRLIELFDKTFQLSLSIEETNTSIRLIATQTKHLKKEGKELLDRLARLAQPIVQQMLIRQHGPRAHSFQVITSAKPALPPEEKSSVL